MNPLIDRLLRPHVIVGATLCLVGVSAGALAQTPRTEPTDFAAVMGESLTTTDAVTGERRRLSSAEVEALAAQRGTHRTADQRRRAAPVNRALAAMPVTVEESLNEAQVSSKGTTRFTSLEEIGVTYGQVDADGGLRANHDPDPDAAARDR
ncbi:hypothetical protein [Luteimonas abyssi]|uniref:hypothetical protein n=1 Tax=Luteimonas abyssi TaxID=1247514 RepID=UPI000737BF6B|nr:hypothetical protein [Luteimonas abyssi]